MKSFFVWPFVAIALLLSSMPARADLDPIIGTRVAMAVTQTLLAQSYLPTLTENREFSPQISYITAKTGGVTNGTDSYDGKFSGYAVGVGYSSGAQKRLGYYGTAMIANTGGEVTADITGAPKKFTMKDFSNTGYSAVFGLSYRLIGKKDGKFAFGLFAAPAIMHFSSTFLIDTTTYDSSAFPYGALYGAQLRVVMWQLMLHPYFIAFNDQSSECRDMGSSAGGFNTITCGGKQSSLALKGSFNAFGFIMGWGDLRANVYTVVQDLMTGDKVTVQNYQLSYGFGF